MKNEEISCGVARDLMPLVIDDACSADSREAVERHMADCEPCAQYFQEMIKEIPVQKADEKAVNGFQRSLRCLFVRFRWWQIISIVLAAILGTACIFVTVNPQILNSIESDVPVAWIQNPQLLRTEQGVLLLRFTPSEKYRHYHGGGYAGQWTDDGYEYRITYRYTLLAKLLSRDLSDDWYQRSFSDDAIIKLANGDWAIPLPVGGHVYSLFGWRYEDGEIVVMTLEELTQEDIVSLLEAGRAVDGNTQMYGTAPLNPTDGKLTLSLSGPDGEKQIYQSGDDIPLCDQEVQEAFDRWVVHLNMPGDLVYNGKG